MKGGVADTDGHLRQGDQILKVNDEDLKTAAQEHAAALLKVKTRDHALKKWVFGVVSQTEIKQILNGWLTSKLLCSCYCLYVLVMVDFDMLVIG